MAVRSHPSDCAWVFFDNTASDVELSNAGLVLEAVANHEPAG